MKAITLTALGFVLATGVCAGVTLTNGFVSRANAASARTAAVTRANASLDSIVWSFGTYYGTKVGIVVYDTSTGHTASTNASQQFVSASLYKLFVAYGVLRDEDAGTVSDSAMLDDVGESVGTCMTKMITVSDNDCGKALGNLIGWDTLDTLLTAQGYTGTMLDNYDSDGNISGDKQTTAADVALLLERLYDGSLLSASSDATLLGLLGSQEINSYLPSGFPAGTKIAHKTGTLYGYVHDAGIVYGGNRNLIVVFMSGQWDNPDPDSIPVFTALSQSLQNYLTTS